MRKDQRRPRCHRNPRCSNCKQPTNLRAKKPVPRICETNRKANFASDATKTYESQDMQLQRIDTAVVFIDPQNDVLSEKGSSRSDSSSRSLGAIALEPLIQNKERDEQGR